MARIYGAKDAQSHLRQKLNYGGERVKTAEIFIDYCASESSMTHRPYQIRFADGRVTNTTTFFHERLKDTTRNNIGKAPIHKVWRRSRDDFIVNMVSLILTDSPPVSVAFKAQYLLLLSALKSRAINLTGIDGHWLFVGSFSANESHSRDSFSL